MLRTRVDVVDGQVVGRTADRAPRLPCLRLSCQLAPRWAIASLCCRAAPALVLGLMLRAAAASRGSAAVQAGAESHFPFPLEGVPLGGFPFACWRTT
jgi:hypothetical protein